MAPQRLICVKKIPPLTYFAYNKQRTSAQVNFLSRFSTRQIWIDWFWRIHTGFGVIFYSSAPARTRRVTKCTSQFGLFNQWHGITVGLILTIIAIFLFQDIFINQCTVKLAFIFYILKLLFGF